MAVVIGRGSFDGFEKEQADHETPPDEQTTEKMSPEDLISSNLQLISHNVSQLKQLTGDIGSSEDSESLRNRVNELQSATNTLTKDTTLAIKLFANECPDDLQPAQWKIQQTRFHETFTKILSDYQEIQKYTRSRMHISLRKSLTKSGFHNVHIEDSGELTVNGKHLLFETKEDEKLALIKERENELKQIEQDIVDINSIFKDLAQMVHSQGEDITEIEKNVEIAEKDVHEAVVELEEAEENVSSSRKKKIFIAAIIFGVLVAVVVIVVAVVVS